MTLGEHRDLSAIVFGEKSKATLFLNQKIAESPHGRDEEVIADESQVLYLLGTLAQEDK